MKNLSLKEYEQLSAYLDGQLSAAEARRVEAQLSQQAAWRQALDELSATRALLQRAPHYRAPRNFTLTPELASQYARKPWFASLASFRLSSAVAALAVLAVVLIQLLPGATAGAPMTAPAAVLQAAAEPTFASETGEEGQKALTAESPASTQAASAEEAASTPAIILWGSNSGFLAGGQAFGRGGGGGSGGGSDAALPSGGTVTYGDQKLGEYSAAMAPAANPDGGLGGGIVTYDGQPAPDSTNLANQPAQAPAPAEAAPESAAAASAAAGPILGLPSSEQAGQIIAEAPISAAQSADSFVLQRDASSDARSPTPAFWSAARLAQVGLLALALLAAGLAVFFRRRAF